MSRATYSPNIEDLKGKPVVLLYSGGLDTSCMLVWLKEKYDCDVVSCTVSIGQEGKDFEQLEEKARRLGVKNHYTIDASKEFIDNYLFPAIKANALYEGSYPLHSALSRPLLAKCAIDVANKENAVAIAHGCTGKGNDQVRINITAYTLDPEIKIIQPIIEWGMLRDQEIKYAKEHNIPIPEKSVYSIDENVFGRSIECGDLEFPEKEPPKDAFEWTVEPEDAPDAPEYIKIGFKRGIPTELNDKKMEGFELIKKLNSIAGAHGVGRIDHLEDRIVGLKSREIYENPAAVCLIKAHKDLEKGVSTIQEVEFKNLIDQKWAYMCYTGLWLNPLMDNLNAFIDKANEKVNGSVTLKLYKGSAQVVGRKSDWLIYDYNLATYEGFSTFNEKASYGFIELWGLQTKMSHQIKKKNEEKE
ncbi:MAG: argininosuccinate synthase [Candidatus Lokiarchaeota archaeon]|nr:argininosuccinate synthase [Candidatus Lokiarchaeota archaeon]